MERGDPLIDKIQAVLKKIHTLTLLWLQPASPSRFVKSEWQAAYHLEKRIIPWWLDDTELPPFLLAFVHCDFRESFEAGRDEVVRALKGRDRAAEGAPARAARGPSPEKIRDLVHQFAGMQQRVINELVRSDPAAGSAVQNQIDPLMKPAVQAPGHDADILNVAGYHAKNEYMIKHWQAIQERKSPKDPLLDVAESYFHQSLAIRPDNASALNGLGSVLVLERDLDAAEFFVRRALAQSAKERTRYEAAEQDLQIILWLKRDLAYGRSGPHPGR